MDVFLLPTELSLLFPTRKGSLKSIDSDTEIKLYQALTCTICSQLMQSPVYLKCSHRFCRACIERRIRNSTKKSCPICHAPLLSKRDLRTDDFTIDFVDVAFNATMDIVETDDDGEEQQAGEEQKAKIEVDNSVYKIRRKYRKRPQSLESSAVANPPNKRKRLNKAVIQVNGSGLKQSYFSNSSKGSNRVEENEELLSGKITDEIKTENCIEIKVEYGAVVAEKAKNSDQQNREKQKPCIQPGFQRQKGELFALKKKYGQSFLKENLSKTPQDIYIRIKLLSHPNKLSTPLLDFSEIDCPINAPSKIISSLLAQNFNLPDRLIQLFVPMLGDFRKVNPMQTLAMLNQEHWMGNSEETLFDIANIISNMKITDQAAIQPSRESSPSRLMYFSIDFTKYGSDSSLKNDD